MVTGMKAGRILGHEASAWSNRSGRGRPTSRSETAPTQGAIDAYEVFDRRKPGWIKVELKPKAA